jgi:hypothetical protein
MAARAGRLGSEALTAAAALTGCRAVDTSAVAADREERLEDETILAQEGSSRAATRSEIQLHPPDGLGLVLAAHAHEPLAPAHARALHSKHAYHHTNVVQHARTHMHTPCSPERVIESAKSHRFVRVQVATKS